MTDPMAPSTPQPRILVLGAAGMLGHKMFQVLSSEYSDVWASLRGYPTDEHHSRVELFQSDRIVGGVDASDWANVRALLGQLRPGVVVNCVGVIKQRADAHSAIPSISVNSLLPHLLAQELGQWGGRLVHISSDCVFSGARGGYSEDDPSDAQDLYGRSKYLGEVSGANALTLRTSIVGRELSHHESLLDWFLQQEGRTVRGYTRALWSGVSTLHLSGLVARIIRQHLGLTGLYQVSSGRMSKFDLLSLFRDVYGLNVRIEPDESVVCDRSLYGSRLSAAIGYAPPSWESMAREIGDDPTPYGRWSQLGRGC
jgi:dTDP-4-dehydrorhamnose reductase